MTRGLKTFQFSKHACYYKVSGQLFTEFLTKGPRLLSAAKIALFKGHVPPTSTQVNPWLSHCSVNMRAFCWEWWSSTEIQRAERNSDRGRCGEGSLKKCLTLSEGRAKRSGPEPERKICLALIKNQKFKQFWSGGLPSIKKDLSPPATSTITLIFSPKSVKKKQIPF